MRLEAQDLAFGYPGKPVGQGVDLALGAGEVVSLLGPNGAGKTTLFKTLLGLLPAQGGRVLLDGQPLVGMARVEIARRIAYVPQAHAAHFPYSVQDMVLMGRTAHLGPFARPGAADQAAALEALRMLGIAPLAEADYTKTSGGQRQLALIARALAQAAPLIIMDEPTASLDFGNQALVLRAIRALAAEGYGIVLATHAPDHAFACATRVALLHRGTLLAQGPPAAILTPARLETVYGIKVAVERLASGHVVCAPDLGPAAPAADPSGPGFDRQELPRTASSARPA
jgi:iron complex transport system ATP-binding protein